MSDAQTEARAIADLIDRITPGNFHHFRGIGDLHGWCERTRYALATAHSAKDAELEEWRGKLAETIGKLKVETDRAERAAAQLAAYRQSSVHPNDHEAVKTQLAEANKAIAELTKSLQWHERQNPSFAEGRRAREAQGGENV